MVSRIFNVLFCFLMLLSFLEVSGQKKSRFFQIPGRVKIEKGDPSGTIVNLINLQSNSLEKNIAVASAGKFDLELNYQTEYKLSVSKDGYYTKDILISTVIPSNVWQKDSIFPPFYIVVNLFQKVPDTSLSFEGKTIGKISYSPKGGLDNFDSENYLNDKDIKDEIETALRSSGDDSFNKILASALEFEKNNDLKSAYGKYLEASKLKPNDKFVKEKLKDLTIDLKNALEDLKTLAEFNRHMALGNANVENKNYQGAILNFKDALKIKPGEVNATAKLAEAEQLLANEIRKKTETEEEFKRLVALGDENVSRQMYPEAISGYKGALQIKPSDPACMDKLATAEKLLAQDHLKKAKLEEDFKRLMASGDKNVSGQKYQEGITDFKNAIILKPDDAIARQKLSSAEGLLANLNAEKARTEEEFKRLVAIGDENVSRQMYPEAISGYKGALQIKPSDPACMDKLATAEKLLAQDHLKKAKLEEDFKRLMASGDKNVSGQKYQEGINDYKNALLLKPDDSIARQKLSSAEGLLANLNTEKARAEEEFKRLVAFGDENVSRQMYPEAISGYKGALQIKPSDPACTDKLATAEKLLAQDHLKKAKLEEDFKRLMASGDKNVSGQKYQEGINDYKNALLLKPDDAIARQKLSSAEGLLANLNTEKARAEEEFKRLVALGDENVSRQMYPEAISGYKGALQIRPSDPACMDKLATAEKLLAQDHLKKAKLEEDFKRLMASGDKNVSGQKYQEGITDYKNALLLKPDDAIARQKLSSAEGLFANLNTEKARAEEEFKRLVALGDENVSRQMYPEAISGYKGALLIKPSDNGTRIKLSSAEELLVKRNQALEASKINKGNESYQLNIEKGDDNYKKSQWAVARFYYVQALNAKPEDQYSITKIESCDKMSDANITSEKLKEFQNLILKGNEAFKIKNYVSARFYYRSSLGLLSWETFPQEKLKEIDQILSEKLTLSEKQLLKENKEKADEAFNKKEYSIARFYYNKTNEISQDEYSLSRLKVIEDIVSGSEEKRINSQYTDFLKKAKDAVQQKNISLARYYYQKAAILKPEEAYSKEELKKLNNYN